jgi:hypothetical protein
MRPHIRLLSLLLAPCLAATTVETVSFDQAVARSTAIVHGKVVRSWVSWDPEHTAIWTHYEIRIADLLKGPPAPAITISEPGGDLDGKHMQVVGAPRYAVGEEVVVFAAETPIGYLRTCGWEQGKFVVQGSLVRSSKKGPAAAQSLVSHDGAGLDAFLARIRGEVARQAR